VASGVERDLEGLLQGGGEFETQVTATGNRRKIGALTAARREHQAVKAAQATLVAAPEDPTATKKLRDSFNALAQQLIILGVGVVPAAQLPDTIVTPSPSGTMAGSVVASPLSKKGTAQSPVPDRNVTGWQHVLTIDSNNWERVHLVSAEFFAPGRVWNLVPARRTDNAWMRDGPEESVKRLIAKNAVLDYRVKVDGYHNLIHPTTNLPIEGFPTSFTISLATMKKEGSGWVIDTRLDPFGRKSLAKPDLTGGKGVDLKTANDHALRDMGLPVGLAGNVGYVKGTGAWSGEADFRQRMGDYYKGLKPPYNVDFDLVHWPLFSALIAQKKAYF
jgi:hypothetical protein